MAGTDGRGEVLAMAIPVGRLGVPGRLLGAILVPVVVLAITLGASVVHERGDVGRSAVVSEHVALLRQLVELRSAVFRERLAVEIFVPSRRPPREVLDQTTFGAQIAAFPQQLDQRTDAALEAIPPADRPFGREQLDRARGEPLVDSPAGGAIQSAFDDVDRRLSEAMAHNLTVVRESAVELGDVQLIKAGSIFERSVRLPEEAGILVAALAELWTAPAAARPPMQSRAAIDLATFDNSTQRLAEALASRGTDVHGVVEMPQMPDLLSGVVDDAMSGALSGAERPPGEPVDVGLALLDGVDWLLLVDDVPVDAAAVVTGASQQVSDSARAAERRAVAVAVAAIACSIVAAMLFGRSIVRPVRRLTRQAEKIGRGQLDREPLDRRGPPEIVRASESMNDVVDNLVLLEQKSHALAQADFGHPSLRQTLPGRLGSALQLSMEVLSGSIEQREALQSQLEFDAAHDALTGVGNRASLTAELQQMHDGLLDPTRLTAVMFIDLNDFKGINDRYGHAAGDEVLRVVASRMLAAAPARAQVARLGGDEFVIVIPDVLDFDEPVDVARRVTTAIAVPLRVGGQTLEVGASVGVALAGPAAGDSTVDPSALLHRADLAVYSAKNDPDDDVAVYDDELDRRLTHQHDIESALTDALRSDSDELHLVFQPIVEADRSCVHSVEALIRWNRSGIGLVGPDEFIPVAESSDLIMKVDQWVIRAALLQQASWRADDSGPRVTMAVNVSGRSLLDRTFVGRVERELDAVGARPDWLALEITETALVSDLDLAATQLAQLSALGVRIVIDDFGTGYTSIAHLRALPVDEMKIDSSFVQQLPEEENRVLVEMVVQLAHQLHLPVVAEGVETFEQAEALRDIGCDSLQGYFFSPPLEAHDLTDVALGRIDAARGT